MTDILNAPKKLIAAWDEFFFAPQSFLPAGVFRFLFALNAFVMYAIRFSNWRFYFTDEGFLPLADALKVLPETYRPDFTWMPASANAAFAMNLILLAALLLLIAGVLPRLAALVGFLMHVALLHRNFSVAYGADFINTFMFFSLIFVRSGDRFSLPAYIRFKRGSAIPVAPSMSQIISSMGVRLLQLQLCIIYAYTGLEKMKGASWWDGTAIWAVIGNKQIVFIDSSWIANVPVLLGVMTFLTLIFEIYFTPLVWVKATRKWILLLGCFMHIGIALSVGLFFFSFDMMCMYILWADAPWLERILIRLRIPRAWIGSVDCMVDSETGLLVFTSEYLLGRGYCCESGCRNCPYGFKK